MYLIYADNSLIYNDIATEETVRLISPTLEWSDNATGSLSFTMPPVNAGYSDLTLMSTKISVYRNEELIWVGRPIKETRDFWKNRQITCEGALGYLNDVVQPQRELPGDDYPQFTGYPAQFLEIVLSYHNQVMRQNGLPERQIFLGQVTVDDMMKSEDPDDEYYQAEEQSGNVETYVPTIYTDFKNTLECISDKLTSGKNVKGDDLEGHLRLRIYQGQFYLDYLKEPLETANQEIEFGKNLLDFTVNYDESDFCTVLYPRGENIGDSEISGLQARLELSEDQDGTRVKDDMSFTCVHPRLRYTAGVSEFGYIERVIDFDDVSDENVLLDKSMEWFTKNRFNDMEIDIKAFDLAYMGVQYEFLKYMDGVRVRSLPHGLDKIFPVLGVSIPLDQPQNASYTLGKKKVQSLSAHSSSVDKDIQEAREYTEQKATVVYHKSESLMRNATTGVVNTMPNQYGAQGLAIIGLERGKNYYVGRTGTPYTYTDILKELQKGEKSKFTIESLPEWYDTSDNKWKAIPIWYWNMGGLGYYQNGINGDAEVAIDMEGHINCKFLYGEKIEGIGIEGSYFLTKYSYSRRCLRIDENAIAVTINDSNTGNEYLGFEINYGNNGHGYDHKWGPVIYMHTNTGPSNEAVFMMIGALFFDDNGYVHYLDQSFDIYENRNDMEDSLLANKRYVKNYVNNYVNGEISWLMSWVEDNFQPYSPPEPDDE